ncbi:hypothetical protein F0L17_06310 [Streptomyces sp. TRM43335]|uniref:Uncharacterized protein n=1 Tax=Streptomyces taklimakanensis TaxID=2569853 RepID=A0A6G2BA26_9ACTN|nr:hypothetical protein [Streptomyces taklimakanensis]MTE18752.1 hypothetical protein [Streptomyces taklimakanensis]
MTTGHTPSRDGDGPDRAHRRPPGLDDATVEAVGKVSEALEATERARGHLYSFHQMTGRADLLLGEAVEMLRGAGHEAEARLLEVEILGRNVIPGHWTFQIVEGYDDHYYKPFVAAEERVRDLVGGLRHLYEAEMKEARRTHGHSAHTARPDTTPPGA